MEEKLKILIEKCAAILDAESINEVWYFYNHDEYEMALEGLLIELISAGKYLSIGYSNQLIDLAIYYDLKNEAVFDVHIWERLEEYASKAGNVYMEDYIIVFVIYEQQKRWYYADGELWFLDENKRKRLYEKAGYKIEDSWLDVKRRDIMLLDTDVAGTFLERMEGNRCKAGDLPPDVLPSLYIDFDKKEFYSMYYEPASYEDYVPIGWKSDFKDFLDLIPSNEQYWKVQVSVEA